MALAERVAGWAAHGRGRRGLRRPGHRDRGPRLRRRSRVAHVGHLGRHRHPGRRRPPARVRLGRLARRVGAGRDAGRGPGQRRVRHGRRARAAGRARRGRRPFRSTCGTTVWPAWPPTAKIELALALEAQARAADPRIRQVDSADYGDVASEAALVSTTGIRSSSRKTSGYLSVGVIAGEGEGQPDRRRLQRRDAASTVSTPNRRCQDAVTRAVRLLGATKGPSGRSTVVFDRRMATALLSDRVLGAVRRGGGQGPVLLRRPYRRAGRPPGPHPGRRPDRPSGLRGGRLRRRGPGLSAQRPDRLRRAAGVPVRHGLRFAGGRRLHRLGCARRVRRHPGSGMPGPHARPGPGGLRRGRGPGRRGGGTLRPVDDRGPLGGQPRSAATSRSAPRA